MKLRGGPYGFAVDLICLILLLGNVIYLIAVWNNMPAQMPMQYDFAGNVTRYGGKSELLILLIINWAMFIGISAVERFPQIWNTGVKVTEENRLRVYKIIKNMIVTLKLTIVASFVFMSISQLSGSRLPGWFLPVYLFVCFAPIVFFIVKLIKAR